MFLLWWKSCNAPWFRQRSRCFRSLPFKIKSCGSQTHRTHRSHPRWTWCSATNCEMMWKFQRIVKASISNQSLSSRMSHNHFASVFHRFLPWLPGLRSTMRLWGSWAQIIAGKASGPHPLCRWERMPAMKKFAKRVGKTGTQLKRPDFSIPKCRNCNFTIV